MFSRKESPHSKTWLRLLAVIALGLGGAADAANPHPPDRWALTRIACMKPVRELAQLELLSPDVPMSALTAGRADFVALLDRVLDQVDPKWTLNSAEREALQQWRRILGSRRMTVRELARPFWVRNALSFVASAPWDGIAKAVILRILFDRIRERNVDPETGNPAWSASIHRSDTGYVIFHGATHRCVIHLASAEISSTKISDEELRAMTPYIEAGQLGAYYRSWPSAPGPFGTLRSVIVIDEFPLISSSPDFYESLAILSILRALGLQNIPDPDDY